jgi:hypothetical protein
MVDSLSIRVFFLVFLVLLFFVFLYRYVQSIGFDRTFAQEHRARFESRSPPPKGHSFYPRPVGDYYLTVLFQASDDFAVTRERLIFLITYLHTNLPDKQFEILCCYQADVSDPAYYRSLDTLHPQYPEIRLAPGDSTGPLRPFTIAALRGRGIFIIDERYLRTELPKLPTENIDRYLSIIDTHPKTEYFENLSALVIAAGAKAAARQLLINVHLTEFGIAKELLFIANAKGLDLHVKTQQIDGGEHSLSYWIVDRAVSWAVPHLYRCGLWTVR